MIARGKVITEHFPVSFCSNGTEALSTNLSVNRSSNQNTETDKLMVLPTYTNFCISLLKDCFKRHKNEHE